MVEKSDGRYKQSTAKNLVNRGERVLNSAVSQRKLTPCGKAAFLAAVDPFHDVPIKDLCGWPDLETAPSVVRHWKASSTVKAVEAGGSILIYSWPILNRMGGSLVQRRNAVIDVMGPSGGTILGPTTIYRYTAADANNLFMDTADVDITTHAVNNEWFQDGPARLIGMGIEVHDVTAVISRQGTCTVFEVPQTTLDSEVVVVKPQVITTDPVVSTSQTAVEVCALRRFPETLEEIMTYPTSRQWDAKEGAYVVVPYGAGVNPPLYTEYRSPWIYADGSGQADRSTYLNVSPMYIGEHATPITTNGDPYVFLGGLYAPVNSRGILLTGLNAESTFTITSTFYLETFPQYNSDLLPLASPSAPVDLAAMNLISRVMKKLPVGCKVEDNFNGEWFWEALEAALPVLGMGASVLAPEFAPVIGLATAGAEGMLRQRQKKKAVKKEIDREVKKEIRKIEKKPASRPRK
jgi:hypothetical protein